MRLKLKCNLRGAQTKVDSYHNKNIPVLKPSKWFMQAAFDHVLNCHFVLAGLLIFAANGNRRCHSDVPVQNMHLELHIYSILSD